MPTPEPDAGSGGSTAAPTADAAPPAPSPLAIGRPCKVGAECASGNCVDGFCCDTACGSRCQACDVTGLQGTCSPVPQGQDPDAECALDPPASCGSDGTCDGNGACSRYPAGTECVPGSCTAGVERAAGTCDGQGQCRQGASQSCMSGVCNGTSCGAACTADSQCQPGFFCDAGNCRTKRPVGGTCTADGQCASAHCADGVCCATACPQACYACDLAATRGSCVPVPDGMDPDNECQAEPAASCGRLGGCNGRGACRLHPATTACGAPSCAGTMATSARTCNGTGQCQAATTTACGNYRCQGTACGTRCTGNAECQTGFVCIDNACSMPPVAKIAGLTVHDAAHAGDWSIQKNFQIGSGGAHPWTDWPATYVVSVDMAAGVIGADWIKVAAESKKYTGGPQATLTLGGTVDVYLAVDDRWGGSPSWLAGWTNTGLKMHVFESGSRPMLPFTLWRKSDQSGTLTLPQIGASTAYDYFVIVN